MRINDNIKGLEAVLEHKKSVIDITTYRLRTDVGNVEKIHGETVNDLPATAPLIFYLAFRQDRTAISNERRVSRKIFQHSLNILLPLLFTL
jgi:hypothetical protein